MPYLAVDAITTLDQIADTVAMVGRTLGAQAEQFAAQYGEWVTQMSGTVTSRFTDITEVQRPTVPLLFPRGADIATAPIVTVRKDYVQDSIVRLAGGASLPL